MLDFESLNKAAQDKQTELNAEKEREKQRQQEIADREIGAFVDYLIEYFAPHVEQTANDVIKRNGAKRERYVHVNDIIFRYKKTPYIMQNYKVQYDEIIYSFMRSVIHKVEIEYREKLPTFTVDFFCGRNNGFFRADHYVRITMQFKEKNS